MAEDAVSILNSLLQASEDGHKRFRDACDVATDAQLKSLFEGCASDCEQAMAELRAQLHALGGEVRNGGTVVAAAHRGWVRVTAPLTDPNQAILDEVARGQDVTTAAYSSALKAPLPPAVLALVQRQARATRRTLDRMRALRDEWPGPTARH